MTTIVIPVGRCRFLEEKRPVCGFEGTKYGGLRDVRPPIIDLIHDSKGISAEFDFL